MLVLRYPVFILLALSVFNVPARAAEFAKLRALEGVANVEYHAPFLCVIIRSLSDVPRIKIAVQAIEAERSDPDVVALGSAYNVRFYNYDSFKIHLRDQSRVERTNTVGELKELCRYARFTSIVTLDWSADPIVVSRQRIHHKNLSLEESWLPPHDEKIDAVLKQLDERGRRPEKLVCFEYPTVGRLVYPVFDGRISLSGNKVSYDAFSKVFSDLD